MTQYPPAAHPAAPHATTIPRTEQSVLFAEGETPMGMAEAFIRTVYQIALKIGSEPASHGESKRLRILLFVCDEFADSISDEMLKRADVSLLYRLMKAKRVIYPFFISFFTPNSRQTDPAGLIHRPVRPIMEVLREFVVKIDISGEIANVEERLAKSREHDAIHEEMARHFGNISKSVRKAFLTALEEQKKNEGPTTEELLRELQRLREEKALWEQLLLTCSKMTFEGQPQAQSAPHEEAPEGQTTGLWCYRDSGGGKYRVFRRDGSQVTSPFFVLMARDQASSEALKAYAQASADLGRDPRFVSDILKKEAEFSAYRAEYGVSSPDEAPPPPPTDLQAEASQKARLLAAVARHAPMQLDYLKRLLDGAPEETTP